MSDRWSGSQPPAPRGGAPRKSGWSGLPAAVRLGAIIAALVVVVAAGAFVMMDQFSDRVANKVPSTNLFGDSPNPSPSAAVPSPTVEPGRNIKGPLNILLVGIDPRPAQPLYPPHADAVMVMHISADLGSAYIFSLPRDLLVDIPAYAPSNYRGERSKLTHAMTFGALAPGAKLPDIAKGYDLLAKTVTKRTGLQFNAGAIVNFTGLPALVNAIGGIDFYVDTKVTSIHRQPNGVHRPEGSSSSGYVGPQMVYNVGMRHFNGWQALDYARQRYGLSDSVYGRQRHHQQMIRAIMAKVTSAGIALNPARVDRVLTTVGKSMLFDGRGQQVIDYAFALRGIDPAKVVSVGLPGDGVTTGGGYQGERLDSIAEPFFQSVRQDKVDEFLAANPKLVTK